MKKKCILLVLFLFFATGVSAITLDAVATRDIVYNSPQRITTTFGKLPSGDEYGVFVHITCKAEEGEKGHESLFYRLPGGTQKDGKLLYTEVDGQRVLLAEKKWTGWKNADGVEIHYRLSGKPYPSCKVWVEVSEK